MDYKSTLNLPKTPFPMKANLPAAEPKMLARWEEGRLYARLQEERRGRERFLLHDGPPYANGDIHMGHALNKVLKDLIVRYRTMRGNQVPFVPGWDCHGLPIEYALMRELKVTKHQVDVGEFRRKARAYARRYVDVQREQFKRLGCLGDWEDPYLTLEPGYVAAVLRALGALVSQGLIYRARKPVNWCWSCETALAEAEVEYEPRTSPSVFVKFALTAQSAEKSGATHLVIWTTTPWTLLGNVAVAVHPDFEYAVWEGASGERWVTLTELPSATAVILRGSGGSDSRFRGNDKSIRRMRGRELEGLSYNHPFGIRKGKVVLAGYVSSEEGTGLVHTAPGFGAEDFATGRKCGLEVVAPVDAQGRFTELPEPVKEFNGRQVQEANPAVVERIEQAGLLISAGGVEHPYPHCWRCHNPIIFRATDQWFLKVEEGDLRERLLRAAEGEVRWIPPEGKDRMSGMLKTRPDWCLSRQRLWGIPIPAVICKKCGEGMLRPEVIERFAAATEADPEGSDRWFGQPVGNWLPAGFTCRCGSKEFDRGTDILDVWFDSGVSHQAVLARRDGLSPPADLYLEGSDQHRGWFQVSLITAVALTGRPPYRAVLTHGFVVDGQGHKMSKSLGNVIAPQEVITRDGADVLRLWAASSDYREDVRLSPEILKQTAEVYRKIRNTIRFMLANLSDFDPAAALPQEQMEELDRWALSRLAGLIEEVTASYEGFAFHRVCRALHEFCTVELSNFYLDVLKDRLYASRADEPARRSAQTALHRIAEGLIRLAAPILPFTAEEAWGAMPAGEGPVHLQGWPQGARREPAVEEVWSRLMALRDEAMKALEQARGAGQIDEGLEAELEIEVGEESLWRMLEPRQAAFADACVVSGLRLLRATGQGAPPVAVRVKPAPGKKCQRCWKRLPSVGEAAGHPGLCARCVRVVCGILPV